MSNPKKLTAADRKKLLRAYCTLADYEWAIKDVGESKRGGNFDYEFHAVCDAVSGLADGDLVPAAGAAPGPATGEKR